MYVSKNTRCDYCETRTAPLWQGRDKTTKVLKWACETCRRFINPLPAPQRTKPADATQQPLL